jgi:hypothetical protein
MSDGFLMKVLLLPFRVIARMLVVSTKLVLATGEVAFRAGYAVGSVPVKGGAAAGRALGPKAVVLFVVGLVLGVVIGRELTARFASTTGELGPVPDLPDEVAVDV